MSKLLVAAHLSTLWPPSRTKTLQIGSIPSDVSLPDIVLNPSNGLSPEHATFSAVFSFQKTKDILLRIIGSGHILELIALQSSIDPIRFLFPSAILPSPGLDIWQDIQLRAIVVTENGSLHRLAFPVDDKLWHSPHRLARWHQEHRINNQHTPLTGPVHSIGSLGVVVALKGGSLLQVEAKRFGDAVHNDDVYYESTFSSKKGFASLAAYIPFQAVNTDDAIVSISSLAYPIESPFVFTLSRSRHLKAWTANSGVVADIAIPVPTYHPHSSSGSGDSVAPQPLLDGKNYIRVMEGYSATDSPRVIVFSPASSPASNIPGVFYVYHLTGGRELKQVNCIPCSATSGRAEYIDFFLHSETLYALFLSEGNTRLESTQLSATHGAPSSPPNPIWQASQYSHILDIHHVDVESLLSDVWVEMASTLSAILRPGLFSVASLQAAMRQYTEALLTLPTAPPQCLLQSYASLEERIASVVGCTVLPIVDPATGELQVERYQKALQRDWEGFVARCLDIERKARYPLGLSWSLNYGVVISERERTGLLFAEDMAMSALRSLREEQFAATALPKTLQMAWKLKTQISRANPIAVSDAWGQIEYLIRQDVSLSYCDVVFQAAQEWDLRYNLVSQLINDLPGVDQTQVTDPDYFLAALEVVLQLGDVVKGEDSRSEDSRSSEWACAISSTFMLTCVQARLDLAKSLAILLLLMGSHWTPIHNQPIAAFLTTCRGISLLSHISELPGRSIEESPVKTSDSGRDYDVTAAFHNMRVTSPSLAHRVSSPDKSPLSVITALMMSYGPCPSLYDTSQATLAATGLLHSGSSCYITSSEIEFCNNIQLLGYGDLAIQCLSYFPNTVGIQQIRAMIYVRQGRCQEAAALFMSVAGQIETPDALPLEDREALETINDVETPNSLFRYYADATTHFLLAGEASFALAFCRLAIDSSPVVDQTYELWKLLIEKSADLERIEDSYVALTDCPFSDLKTLGVDYIVRAVCERDAPCNISLLQLAGVREEVESALRWKARNESGTSKPFYAHILYSWYMQSGDYRQAALVMYEHACRLSSLMLKGQRALPVLRLQVDAYLLAVNALDLLGSSHAWFTVDMTSLMAEAKSSRQSRRLVPEDLFGDGSQCCEVIDLPHLRKELVLSTAYLELSELDIAFLGNEDRVPTAEDLIERYASLGRFDSAFAMADTLGLDLTELFERVVDLCLQLQKTTVESIEMLHAGLLQNIRSIPGSGLLKDRAWQYLEAVIDRFDSADNDFSYSQVSMQRIIRIDGPAMLPKFLLGYFTANAPELLIQACLKWGYTEWATQLSASLLAQKNAAEYRITTGNRSETLNAPIRNSGERCQPYNLFERALAVDQGGAGGQSQVRTQFTNLIKAL